MINYITIKIYLIIYIYCYNLFHIMPFLFMILEEISMDFILNDLLFYYTYKIFILKNKFF